MTVDQANAIIDSVTGLPRDHWDRLSVASEIGRSLLTAVETLRGVE